MTRRCFLKVLSLLGLGLLFPKRAQANYVVTGSCNHCGVCCITAMRNPVMLDPDRSEIVHGKTYNGICWFYDKETSSTKYCCRLYGSNQGIYKNVPLRENDPNFGKCTKEMYDYLQNECKPYPQGYTAQQLLNWKDHFELPPECGFSIEEV
jgi:hypothetical protein